MDKELFEKAIDKLITEGVLIKEDNRLFFILKGNERVIYHYEFLKTQPVISPPKETIMMMSSTLINNQQIMFGDNFDILLYTDPSNIVALFIRKSKSIFEYILTIVKEAAEKRYTITHSKNKISIIRDMIKLHIDTRRLNRITISTLTERNTWSTRHDWIINNNINYIIQEMNKERPKFLNEYKPEPIVIVPNKDYYIYDNKCLRESKIDTCKCIGPVGINGGKITWDPTNPNIDEVYFAIEIMKKGSDTIIIYKDGCYFYVSVNKNFIDTTRQDMAFSESDVGMLNAIVNKFIGKT